MVDFKNSTFFKLKKVSNEKAEPLVGPLLVSDENIVSAYKGLRDQVVFTNKRIISKRNKEEDEFSPSFSV